MKRYSIWSWNRGFEISGAMYSVVPQNVYVMLFEHSINLANPKSQSLIYPSLSSKTFSSFRSLNYCFWHLEIPTGSPYGNNLFSFPWNGKFSSVLWSDGDKDKSEILEHIRWRWMKQYMNNWNPPRFETVGRHFI